MPGTRQHNRVVATCVQSSPVSAPPEIVARHRRGANGAVGFAVGANSATEPELPDSGRLGVCFPPLAAALPPLATALPPLAAVAFPPPKEVTGGPRGVPFGRVRCMIEVLDVSLSGEPMSLAGRGTTASSVRESSSKRLGEPQEERALLRSRRRAFTNSSAGAIQW